jgi:fused signal recognition particle receptor
VFELIEQVNPMDQLTPLLHKLQELSSLYGSGNLEADLTTALIVLAVMFFVLCFYLILQRKHSAQLAQSSEANRGVAGRVEKFEMNFNAARTELAREVEFLKNRVAELEGEVATLQGKTPKKAAEKKTKEDTAAAQAPSVEPLSDLEAAFKQVEATEPEALGKKLSKTRSGFFSKLKNLFSGKAGLDAGTLEELEALLVSSDLGVKMTESLVAHLQEGLRNGEEFNEDSLLSTLKGRVAEILTADCAENLAIPAKRIGDTPRIVMMVGVNGVGKTTTTAKIAASLHEQGAKVLMVAADTFRAAAVEQLRTWGDRIGVPVVSGEPEAKPSTVVYDAMQRCQNEDIDVVLIDTAGRLHTRSNLMQELEGIRNVVSKHIADAPHDVLLVVDGSTGQNALSQAREFNDSVELTGLIVTKLDGTPKGGIVVAIKNELGIPVRYIGVGESTADLREFKAEDFVEALFDKSQVTELEQPSAHAQTRRRRRREDGAVAS